MKPLKDKKNTDKKERQNDIKEDKKLIKSMVKKSCVKKKK